ncbi:MAG: DUF2339 domain-containing protein, partial [Bradyrhizobium sp.]
MFDELFVFFPLALAIVALIFARKAMNQVAELRRRLEAIEARPAAAAVQPPPLSAFESFEQTLTPVPADAAPAPPPLPPAIEAAAPLAPEDTPEQPVLPPTPPPPARGFEETIGTQWVVWVGGLTLALGGFFMVRYSIEAGLIGPGVRVFLGGLLATALVAAGEWTRRSEFSTGLANVPSAHIPGILTAAGTTVAFATIYAAYAL